MRRIEDHCYIHNKKFVPEPAITEHKECCHKNVTHLSHLCFSMYSTEAGMKNYIEAYKIKNLLTYINLNNDLEL